MRACARVQRVNIIKEHQQYHHQEQLQRVQPVVKGKQGAHVEPFLCILHACTKAKLN